MPLCFVRHGQTDWNLERRFQSRTDVPLNDTGRCQARQIRKEFLRREIHFARAYCSPLSRALETAQIILAGTDVEPLIEPAFIELDLGLYEGCLEHELRARYGPRYDDWRAESYILAAPGGESVIDGEKRVRAAIELLRLQAVDEHALIVAHQGIMMAMKVSITGRSDLASVRSFMQANDVIELWDAEHPILMETFKAASA